MGFAAAVFATAQIDVGTSLAYGSDLRVEQTGLESIACTAATILVSGFVWAVSYPFSDHGLRFDDYPYAHHKPYFLEREASRKTLAVDVQGQMWFVLPQFFAIDAGGTLWMASGCDFDFDIAQRLDHDRARLHRYAFNYGPGHEREMKISQWSFGIGLTFIEDSAFRIGGTVQGGFVWFVGRNFSVRARAAVQIFIPEVAGDLSAEVGYFVYRFAVTAGLRYLVGSPAGDLFGPMAGIQVWF